KLLNSMSSLCYNFTIWLSCVGSFMADSRLVSARVGSTAVLPCEWRNVPVQTPHVQWNTDTDIVFERKGEQLFEGEGYEDRVDVPQDKLLEGNCSLVLKNVSVTDAGVYQSYLSVKRMKRASSTKWVLVQRVEVSVDEMSEETSQDSAGAREAHVYERLT
ncbi:programmed cell death 1 ligand 1-like, partial [Clarias magur]